MWMRTSQGGLAATLYGPSRLRTTVGSDATPVEIVQETNYPFEETITFRFAGEHSVAFPLSLRVPGWCRQAVLTINGGAVVSKPENGFLTVDQRFRPGDVLKLHLPMKIAASHWPQQGVALERGPLVFALPIETNWSPVVRPRYSTETYPAWNATPGSDWNYGLALQPGELEGQIVVRQKPVSDDPWSDPPIRLIATGRKIEEYELQVNRENPAQRFTPPLPALATAKIASASQPISLVPYGSTHLRVTIFPAVGPATSDVAG